MTDDDLITALREQRGKVPMTTPVEQIISRSRALRARRRVPGVAATLGAAVAAAVAVTLALQPVSHQPSRPPHAELAAWTVVKQSDGTVLVKIREFRDRAGLQRKLRADGIPASVIFSRGLPANPNRIPGSPCRQYNGGRYPERWLLRLANLVDPHARDPFQAGVVIHPSLLPRHAGILFLVTRSLGYSSPQNLGGMAFFEDLVQASPQCTGS